MILCDMEFTWKRKCWFTAFRLVLVNELYWQEISTQAYTKCTRDFDTLVAFFLYGVRANKNKR